MYDRIGQETPLTTIDNVSTRNLYALNDESNNPLSLNLTALSNINIESVNDMNMYTGSDNAYNLYSTEYDPVTYERADRKILSIGNDVIANKTTIQSTYDVDIQPGTAGSVTVGKLSVQENANKQVIDTSLANFLFTKPLTIPGPVDTSSSSFLFKKGVQVSGDVAVANNLYTSCNIYGKNLNVWTDKQNSDYNRVGYGIRINDVDQLEIVKYLQFQNKNVFKKIAVFGNSTNSSNLTSDVNNYLVFDSLSGSVATSSNGTLNTVLTSGSATSGQDMTLNGTTTLSGDLVPAANYFSKIGATSSYLSAVYTSNVIFPNKSIIINGAPLLSGAINSSSTSNAATSAALSNVYNAIVNQQQASSPWTSSNGLLYIVNSNVGIGTTNPYYNLHVNGTLAASTYYNLENQSYLQSMSNVAYSASNIAVAASNNAFAVSNIAVAASNNAFAVSNIAVAASNNSFAVSNIAISASNIAVAASNNAFAVSNIAVAASNKAFANPWNVLNSNSYVLTGNVGVGSSNPVERLDVRGNMLIGTNFPRTTYSNTNIPVSDGKINGINITTLNARTRASFGTALRCTGTWTFRTNLTSFNHTSICWSPELGIFVSGTMNGSVTYSSDGITWSNTPVTQTISNICWSPQLNLFVAVSYGAGGGTGTRALTSSTGTTWTTRTTPADNDWNSVCWSPELSLFVAVASTGTGNRIMTSPNGITWTARSSPLDMGWDSVCWSPELNLFVAVAISGTGNRVMTSSNGINWTARASANDTMGWSSVCWSPELGLFAAVASSGTGNRVMTSPNGITWTSYASSSDTNDWTAICWSPELSIFTAVANAGTNRVMISPDGMNWTARTSANETSTWSCIAWSPELSMFVSGAYNWKVMTSARGISTATNSVIATQTQLCVSQSNGYVGIGTSNPSSLLHIQSQRANGSNTDTTPYMKIIKTGMSNYDSAGIQVGQGTGDYNTGTLQYFNGTGAVWSYMTLGLDSTQNGLLMGYNGNSNSASTSLNGKSYVNISTNNLERMRFDSNGYIGIGTSNPSCALDITGSVNITSNLNVMGTVTVSNVIINNWEFNNSNLVVSGKANFSNVATFGSNIYCSTGSVCIGKSNPSAPLHIYGVGPTAIIQNATGSSNTQVRFLHANNTTNAEVGVNMDSNLFLANKRAGNISFETNATERLRIDANGNVGVGTVAPAYKLDVTGNGKFSSDLIVNGFVGIGTSTPSSALDVVGNIESSRGLIVNPTANVPSFTGNQFYSFIQAPLGSNAFFGGDVFTDTGFALGIDTNDKDSTNKSKLKLTFGTSAGSFLTSATRMTFDNNGNVGVGITNPTYRMDVGGQVRAFTSTSQGVIVQNTNATSNNSPAEIYFDKSALSTTLKSAVGVDYVRNFFIWVNGSDRLNIDTTGNVGIGTTAPSSLLHVQSQRAAIGSTTDTTPYLKVIKTGMSNYDSAVIQVGQGTGDYNTGSLQYITGTGNTYAYMTLGLDSTQAAFITSYNGNSNNASTGINGRSFVNISTNNIERMRLDSSGNVGIGTQNPSYRLDVTGGMRVVQDGSSGSLRIGPSNAGQEASIGFYNNSNMNGTGAGAMWVMGQNSFGVGASNFAVGCQSTGTIMAMLANGNIGVGTNSPAYKLDVSGSIYCSTQLRFPSSDYGARVLIWDNGLGGYSGLGKEGSCTVYACAAVADYHKFVSYSLGTQTELMRLTGSGNLGLGTTSPSYKLDVSGNARVSTDLTVSGSTYINGANSFVFTKQLYEDIGYTLDICKINTYAPNVLYVDVLGQSGGRWTQSVKSYELGINNSSVASATWYRVQPLRSGGGIATGGPGNAYYWNFELEVKYDTTATVGLVDVYLRLVNTDKSTDHPAGSSSIPVKIYVRQLTMEAGSTITELTSTAITAGNAGNTNYHPNSSITQYGGNVGMGTLTPSAKLQVRGDLRLHPDYGSGKWLRAQDDSNVEVTTFERVGNATRINTMSDLIFNPNGNVGISTSTPAYKLDVNGNARINNLLYTNNQLNNNVICMYKANSTPLVSDTNYYGFGMNSAMLRYNVDSTGADHAFYANTTEIMRVKGTGRVGIGTSAPSAPLHVTATSSLNADANGIYVYNPVNSASNNAIITARVAGSNAGNPYLSLDVNGAYGWCMGIDNADGRKLKIKNSWMFGGNSFITCDGTGSNVGIGIDNPSASYRLHVSGNAYASGTVTQGSDRRFKENITPITDALSLVSQINGYRYTRNDEEDKTKTHIGLIAQEVAPILPEVVSYDATNDKYGVNYGNMAAVLVEAVKELRAESCKKKETTITKTSDGTSNSITLRWPQPVSSGHYNVIIETVQQATAGDGTSAVKIQTHMVKTSASGVSISSSTSPQLMGDSAISDSFAITSSTTENSITLTASTTWDFLNNSDKNHSFTINIKQVPNVDVLGDVTLL
jgi:hypothetical protein